MKKSLFVFLIIITVAFTSCKKPNKNNSDSVDYKKDIILDEKKDKEQRAKAGSDKEDAKMNSAHENNKTDSNKSNKFEGSNKTENNKSNQSEGSTKTDNNKADSSKGNGKSSQEEIDIKKMYKDGIYYENKAVVLTYHHISSKPFSSITISPERFELDLKMLRDNGFNVVSLRQVLNSMEGTETLPKNAVAITFDDGIESFYKYAYPLLKEYNMPAVNFVITSRVESYSPSSNDFNPLSKNEIKEMYDSGIIDIQSHSHEGHDYIVIGPENKMGGKLAYKIYNPKDNTYETDESIVKRVTEDLNTSRGLIYEYTGNYPDMICFPFGHYNKRLVELSKKCGYKYFVTTAIGYNKYNSKSKYVLRIRSGDSNLTSEKLFKNIVYCANDIKPNSTNTKK